MASDVAPPRTLRRILIVCHANTGRSVIAEALLGAMLRHGGHDRVVVRSGGIAPYARDSSLVSLDTRLVLREDGIELPPDATACDLKHHPERLAEADLIVAMTDEQKRMLADFAAARGKHVLTLREAAGERGDIDDPAGQGDEVYRSCRDEIRRCLAKALARLVAPGAGEGGG